jgi:SIR2-like domain
MKAIDDLYSAERSRVQPQLGRLACQRDFRISAGLAGDRRQFAQPAMAQKEAAGGEDALAELQEEHERRCDEFSRKPLNDLQVAIVGMFNMMDQSFATTTFEPQHELNQITPRPQSYARSFLFQFDAILTLNQDLLLERHYLNENINRQQSQKWNGWQIPGMKRLHVSAITDPVRDRVAMLTPEEPLPAAIAAGQQPYFKLHGSSNWMNGASGSRLFIMGGNKAIEIDRYPILSWYHRQFRDYLLRPEARLMVIGYSFNDGHINNAIVNAADQGTLRIFIIDQQGVDVIGKRNRRIPVKTPDPLMEKLSPRIIGASRRTLTSTFGSDNVEHSKSLRFFEI